MKIALLQCNTTTGDITGNARLFLQATRKAVQEGAVLCVTPELALCGPRPQHLLYGRGFLQGCDKALAWLAKNIPHGASLLIGAPVASLGTGQPHIYNAAVLVQNGSYSVASRKVFPGYAGQCESDAGYFEHGVACGLITMAGWRWAIVICDEGAHGASFWKPQQANALPPLTELMARGVDGIIHMAASPCVVGMQEVRERTYSHVAARYHVHVLVANCVGGNDGTVYAGQSLACDATGALLARGRAFEEDNVLVDTGIAAMQPARLCASPEEECWNALVLGTRDYLRKSGLKDVLVGLSGGMDSALVAAIAVEALGARHVFGVLLPSPYTSQESLDLAEALAKRLRISTRTLPIEPAMRAFADILAPALDACPAPAHDTTLENVQARIRGTLLMALANRQGAVVLNTGNKSEGAMGYCTLYGDAVGGLAVIGDVTKTEVYRLARWYNAQNPRRAIPQGIIDRVPTAELRLNQRDSDTLPPYELLDPMIAQVTAPPHDSAVEDDAFEAHAVQQAARGLGGSASAPEAPADGVASPANDALYERVFQAMRAAEFKRRQMPMCLRVSGAALGEAWRIPVVSKMQLPD